MKKNFTFIFTTFCCMLFLGINGVANAASDVRPRTELVENDGSQELPFTVEEATAMQDGYSYWVVGYIVGMPQYVSDTERPVLGTSQTALAIADLKGDLVNWMTVQLPNGFVRADLNLVDNPYNLGKKIMLYGELKNYIGTAAGIRKTSEYIIIPAETESVTTIADLKAVSLYETALYSGVAIITHKESYGVMTICYIEDETGGIRIQTADESFDTYRVGDKVTGIEGLLLENETGATSLEIIAPLTSVSTGNVVIPTSRNIEEVSTADEGKLVNVKGVFDPSIGQTVFETATPVAILGSAAVVTPMFEALVGVRIPEKKMDITGIVFVDRSAMRSTQASQVISISPRSATDITPVVESGITPENLSNFGMSVDGSDIRVDAAIATRIEVYNTLGKKIASRISDQAVTTISVTKGQVYIVKAGEKVDKVIVL